MTRLVREISKNSGQRSNRNPELSTFVIPSVAEGTAVRLEGSSLLAGTQASALDGMTSHTIQAEQAKNRFPSRILAEQPCSILVSLIAENLIWTALASGRVY